jgi:N-methylhydantoinase A
MTYGHASPGEPGQLVNVRVSAVGHLHGGLALGRGEDEPVRAGGTPASRLVYFRESGLIPCQIVSRAALAPGTHRVGPLIVEAADTTIVVPPGWRLRAEVGGSAVLDATPHA